MITEELKSLWIRKLNFPVIKLKSIVRRVENLISEHDTFIKRPGQKDEKVNFAGIFESGIAGKISSCMKSKS